MIRSTKLSVKFGNSSKLKLYHEFIDEYNRVCQEFIDLLWDSENIPILLLKETTSRVSTWLSARIIQCAGKQASGIVRGTRQKQKQREYIYNKLIEEGKFKKARKLKNIIDEVKISKPQIIIKPELDSRFVNFDFENETIFDIWVKFGSIGRRIKFSIPIRKSKHFNRLEKLGEIKQGVRISKKDITFMFELPEVEKKEIGNTLGLDVGIKKVYVLSNGERSKEDKHGWNLDKINKRLSKKKKGSKNFKRAQEHRSNYINWSLKQIDLSSIKEIRIENIKDLRRGNRCSRYLSHFVYPEIFGKLGRICEENGVQLTHVNPTYTSQRCSKCGWTRKANRNGERFKCGKCGYTVDADLNASMNISFDLPSIERKKRLSGINKRGFYWLETSKDNIVPSVREEVVCEYFSIQFTTIVKKIKKPEMPIQSTKIFTEGDEDEKDEDESGN